MTDEAAAAKRGGPWLRVLEGAGAPRWNMAVDEALMSEAEDLVLRLYSWNPHAVSLGFFQRPEPALIEELAAEGIGCVRRLTGGGAILHAHELTYSLAGPESMAPLTGGVEPSYRYIHDCLITTFEHFGVDVEYAAAAPRAIRHADQPFLCFARSTALDLTARGKKIVGSAKRRRDGRALQHGSILLAPHPRQVGAITLSELTSEPPPATEFGQVFAAEVAKGLGRRVAIGELTSRERERAAAIEKRLSADLDRP